MRTDIKHSAVCALFRVLQRMWNELLQPFTAHLQNGLHIQYLVHNAAVQCMSTGYLFRFPVRPDQDAEGYMKIDTQVAVLTKNAESLYSKRTIRRDAWQRLMMKWHWISAALALMGMLFFATTGLTLLNEGLITDGSVSVTRHEAQLPATVLDDLQHQPRSGLVLPDSLSVWARNQWRLDLHPKAVERHDGEIFVDLKRPGVDAWMSIDPVRGLVRYESSDQGWLAYFNDLHRGKNAGPVWHWLVTAFALCCIVFSLTGLALLQIRARRKWAIWPVVGFGLMVPAVLVLLFVH